MTCSWFLYQLLTGGTQKRGDFRTADPWIGGKSSPKKPYPPPWMLPIFMENWELWRRIDKTTAHKITDNCITSVDNTQWLRGNDWYNTVSINQSTNQSLTHSLTPCSSVILEKLTGSQLTKKFPAFYAARRFITTFTTCRFPEPVLSIPCPHIPLPEDAS